AGKVGRGSRVRRVATLVAGAGGVGRHRHAAGATGTSNTRGRVSRGAHHLGGEGVSESFATENSGRSLRANQEPACPPKTSRGNPDWKFAPGRLGRQVNHSES